MSRLILVAVLLLAGTAIAQTSVSIPPQPMMPIESKVDADGTLVFEGHETVDWCGLENVDSAQVVKLRGFVRVFVEGHAMLMPIYDDPRNLLPPPTLTRPH